VKDETRAFYERAVRAAVATIAAGLDDALELAALARGAALSPLHFHHVFRGMLGETPLELHRRLRLERAAWQLANRDDAVTRIAFDAGYETHESFTRAFRGAFAASPSEFRDRARRDDGCTRPPDGVLAARSGLHFTDLDRVAPIPMFIGEHAMNVEVHTMPELRVAAVRHAGPYNEIAEAFARLGAIAGPAGLLRQPGVTMVAIYHDDPETTAAAELRSDAGLVIPPDAALPRELVELHLPPGSYARTTHRGPYTRLGDAWARFMGEWLPASGHRVGPGGSYEVYRNTPETASPDELVTDLYLSIA